MQGKFRVLAMVAVFALAAAACGDSGSLTTEDASDAPTGDTTGATTADTTAGTTGDTVPPATLPDTIPASIGNIPGLSDDCRELANVFLGMSGVFLGGDVPDVNLDAIGDLPGDLQDDAAVVLATLQTYADGVQELGIDFSDPASFAALTEEQQQAFGDLTEAIDTDEFNDAADRLTGYAEVECADVGG